MRYTRVLLAILLVGIAGLSAGVLVMAQEGDTEAVAGPVEPVPACQQTLDGLWALVSDACATGPSAFVCNGGTAPQARPSGSIANSLAPVGALVETDLIEAVQTAPIITEVVGGGVMWFRWGEPHYITGLLLGEVVLFDVTQGDLPPWTSMLVQTGVDRPDCATTPHNTFVLEAQPNILSRVTVNGVPMEVEGVVAVRTIGESTVFVSLAGRNRVTVQGIERELWTGQQLVVSYAPGDFSQPVSLIGDVGPLDPIVIENFPVGLLDQPVWMPQPGYAMTEGLINLRSEPSLEGLVIGQVPAGELLTVIGQNPEGDWLHVSVSSGYSGWMFAELLSRNLGAVQASYSATPSPPQRYGTLTTVARVRAPAGLNVRENPDTGFAAVGVLQNGAQVNMVARSPYSPWVKVADGAGNELGWVAVIALDTRANVSALPIDDSVPPPPADIIIQPTAAPGSFGNAFPDPNGPSF
ncbi:MAG: SH3 domain-containing protein [Chloroflexota bacterium]